MFIFPAQLTTSRIGNLTRLTPTLLLCDDHTYIYGDLPRQHPLLELPGGLLALCRRTFGSERHR